MKNVTEINSPTADSLFERNITHAAEITFENDRYTTPITIKFLTSTKETTIDVATKYRTTFTIINFFFCRHYYEDQTHHLPSRLVSYTHRVYEKIRSYQRKRHMLSTSICLVFLNS